MVIGVLTGTFAELGVLSLTVAFALISTGLYIYRDRVAELLDLGPAVDVIEHVRPGLTDKEVEEFSTLHQEYLQMKDEKRDEMQKEARQNHSQGGTLNKR